MKELLEKWLNKNVYIQLGGLMVEVQILDVKKSYGKERFLVSPIAGEGRIWVEAFSSKN